jgi:hypothetical protein
MFATHLESLSRNADVLSQTVEFFEDLRRSLKNTGVLQQSPKFLEEL